jgi:hypothetical protein
MSGKRGDRPGITVRLTETEEAKVRLAAAKLEMEVSESFRRAWAIGISILLTNDYARRIEIKDVKIE